MPEPEEHDEIKALSEELNMQQTPGWERRRTWLVLLLQEKGKDLMLGAIVDERQRHHNEGWCQAIDFILKRDVQVLTAWGEFQAEQQRGGEEQLEGGDYGLFYEASK